MIKLAPRLRSHAGPVVAGLTVVCLSLSSASGGAAAVISAPQAVPANAALYVLDSTGAGMHNSPYLQVVGEGFRPGERVTVNASLALPAHGAGAAIPFVPVQVAANDYGQVAATLDGGGSAGAGDGFVIRANGDQHAASIVDLVLPGASYTAPGGD
jgi:hypothetical protein